MDDSCHKTETHLKQVPLEQARQAITTAQHPLLICHLDPDGDAIGSLVGLGRALRQIGLDPILACPDPVPASFDYISGTAEVVTVLDTPFDLVISLDCSDLQRLGSFPQHPAFDRVPLINIDHHVTNLGFGQVNLVDSSASSTAEIVLRLVEHMAMSLDTGIATALLTGIVGDTRGFRTSNVTPQVLEAALKLMRAGASLSHVSRHSLDTRPTSALLLWGTALSRLQVQDRLIWTSIPVAARSHTDQTNNDYSGLSSFLLSSEDADVAAVLVERPDGQIEVGMRAMPGFNVARVALRFGGGGHAPAAGCTLPGPLEEAESRLLEALKTDLAERRIEHEA
jgi:phosphoesterase RecJ-like protein